MLLSVNNHTILKEITLYNRFGEFENLKIGIIGKGHVGTAIGEGLTRRGHQVKHGHRDPKEPVAEAAKWGEVIILAVPYENVTDATKAIGSTAD
jgi:predicted dinucleotide-binding enzyme